MMGGVNDFFLRSMSDKIALNRAVRLTIADRTSLSFRISHGSEIVIHKMMDGPLKVGHLCQKMLTTQFY